jgi:hypothetical protein
MTKKERASRKYGLLQSPQANAIIERVYKVVNDMFRSFDLENNDENLET